MSWHSNVESPLVEQINHEAGEFPDAQVAMETLQAGPEAEADDGE